MHYMLRMLLLLLLAIFMSCVNKIKGDVEEVSQSNSNITLKITAKNLLKQIYAADNNAYVGLYLLQGTNLLAKDRCVSNLKLLCSNSELIAEKSVYYPDAKLKYRFIGYYPYLEKGIADKSTLLDVSVLENQSTSFFYNASDFMTSEVDNITPSSKMIDLPFHHKMSQVSFIIKCAEGTSVNSLKLKAPKILIANTFLNASYNFDDSSFKELSNSKSITPYGQWVINDNKLIGKKCLLIPQTIPSYTTFIYLVIDDKTYECKLTENINFNSGESKEIVINYDSRNNINEISISISDWNDGGSNSVIAEDKDEKEYIAIDEVDFEKSNVYTVYNRGIPIAQICKEFLLNEYLSEESIVIYSYKNDVLDDINGLVWQYSNYDDENVTEIEWLIDYNSFLLKKGKQIRSKYLYIDEQRHICFIKPDAPLLLSIEEVLLVDNRLTEVYRYPIVKIATSYWMREDLKATKYVSGKGLTLKKESNYNKTTSGYFEFNNHRFYNLNSIKVGGIAPKGWHISTMRDWEKLNAYINGSTSYLKQVSKWSGSEMLPNNYSNFSVVPTGIFTLKQNEERSIFAFQNQYTIYWRMSNNLIDVADKAVSISYASDNLKDAIYSEFSGYCIRCVRD